jgi:adhesin transport system membrane fusion protein
MALSAEFAADLKAAARGPRTTATLLLLAMAAFVIAAIAWAGRARVDEVAVGAGRVIPTSQVQVVQNLEGGILSALMVTEGDVVEAGQVLLRIDDTTFASSFRENRARYLGFLASLARLEAEVEGKPVVFPADLADEREVVANERALLDARRAELDASLDVLRRQEEQRKQELLELQRRITGTDQRLALARQELGIMAPMVERGVTPRVELLRVQRLVNELEQDLETARISVPKADAALAEAQRRQAERRAAFRSAAQQDLNTQRVQLRALQESLTSVRDRVARTEVKSPVRGIVQRVKVNTIGGVIKPGDDLVEIVPLDDTLLVEARIRPSDIAFLRPGQSAQVKLTAYDYATYGILPGKLEYISADTIVDEQGQSYYRIRVRTETNYLGTEDKPLHIIPGMVAQVDVVTGKKTVLEYLLKPVIRARTNALRER